MNRAQNSIQDFRHEYKHTINLLDYYTISQRIKTIAKVDPNALDKNKYLVRSLYFDNDDDKALKQKINGLPNREKFRIRLYNNNANFIRLEKKSKVNSLSRKQTEFLSFEQTKNILSGNINWMLNSGNSLITEFYSKIYSERLKPKTIVDYYREAYLYPYGNVRITFDSDIKTGLYCTDLFEYNLSTISVGDVNTLLLEVKYDNYLPDIIRDLIQTNIRQSSSFSKYAISRIYG